MPARFDVTLAAPPPLPRFPAESGLVARFISDLERDVTAITDLTNVSLIAAGEPARENAERLLNEYRHPAHGDPLTDAVLVERNGTLVGQVLCDWREDDAGGLDIRVGLELRPDASPRDVGLPLIQWGLARGRQFAASHTAERRWFRSWCQDHEAWKREALAAVGFQPERHFYLMERASLADLTPAPALPTGIEVRPVRPEHWRPVWEADLEAFRDHWGTEDATEAGFLRFQDEKHQRPDLWQIAWAGDEVAGHVLVAVDEAENDALALRRGWLDSVAVRRPWRRRGLATALVSRALHALRDAGYAAAALGVDAANPNEALGLYQRSGFAQVSSATAYRRPFDD